MKYNIIGFSNSTNLKHKQCVIHPGTSLIQNIEQPDTLYCPMCGTSYTGKDTAASENYTSKFGPQTSGILSPKKQKKQYDDYGNEVKDSDLQGYHVVHYNETVLPANSETNSRSSKFSRKG